MDKVVILDVGVEGGGATIFGRQVEGVWSFWQEGTAMDLDENDDEFWRGWQAEPGPALLAALPNGWYKMYPTEIHPEFVSVLRHEYERCRGAVEGGSMMQRLHARWQQLLSISPVAS